MLLITWAQRGWFQLNEEQERIDRNASGKPRRIETFSREERKKFDDIRVRMRDINQIVDHSICKCASCGVPNKDMTYNPRRKEWFCIDCYQKLQRYFNDKQEAYMFP